MTSKSFHMNSICNTIRFNIIITWYNFLQVGMLPIEIQFYHKPLQLTLYQELETFYSMISKTFQSVRMLNCKWHQQIQSYSFFLGANIVNTLGLIHQMVDFLADKRQLQHKTCHSFLNKSFCSSHNKLLANKALFAVLSLFQSTLKI